MEHKNGKNSLAECILIDICTWLFMCHDDEVRKDLLYAAQMFCVRKNVRGRAFKDMVQIEEDRRDRE